MTVRRMTAEDYAELGMPSPFCAACGKLPPCRCELREAPARCEACGDERGECLCHDD